MGVYDDPGSDIQTITPTDDANIGQGRGVRVSTTAGDVAVRTQRGFNRVITNVQIGEVVPLRITEVRATGTTAVGIEVFY